MFHGIHRLTNFRRLSREERLILLKWKGKVFSSSGECFPKVHFETVVPFLQVDFLLDFKWAKMFDHKAAHKLFNALRNKQCGIRSRV